MTCVLTACKYTPVHLEGNNAHSDNSASVVTHLEKLFYFLRKKLWGVLKETETQDIRPTDNNHSNELKNCCPRTDRTLTYDVQLNYLLSLIGSRVNGADVCAFI